MANITDVALAAGVSISTVSYALSGKRRVSDDTRLRIEAAVHELGYSPNAGARMLAGTRTQIFAVTEPLRMDTHTPTHLAFVLATAIASRRHDYDVLLLTDEQAQSGMRRVAANGLVDAILVLDVATDDPRVDLARAIDTPTVFIGVPADNEGLICVDLDFEAATAMAVDRLADAGHDVIGLIGQTELAYENSNFPPRVQGSYVARAAEREIDAGFATTGSAKVSRTAARRAAVDQIERGATALVLHCAEEAHASILAEIAERGLRIPEDLSVISIGASFDVDALSTPIDSIPLVPAQSCDLAVQLAFDALSNEPPAPGVRLLTPVYESRGTVAAARTT